MNKTTMKVFDTLKYYINKKGYAPSCREICDIAELKSTATAKYHLDKLEKLGYIKKNNKIARAIKILKEN